LFDTQVAAMVLGYGDSIAYDQLVQRIANVTIDKSSRFTDWSRRPLSDAQIAYALSDVIHLRPVYERLSADLAKRGRTDWVADEMSVLSSVSTYRQAPEDAWQRIKARVRKPKELAVLMEVAAWREREAQSRDVPRGRIVKDETIGDIVTQCPTSAEKLAQLRSIPKGFERSRWGEEIVAAVKRGLERDPATLPEIEKPRQQSNGAAATVELLRVLLRMTSEKHGVAAKVIATTDDLDAIAGDDAADVPALKGWRRDLFGDKALALKHGKLALGISGSRVKAIEIGEGPAA
jgi:ribonuclease D